MAEAASPAHAVSAISEVEKREKRIMMGEGLRGIGPSKFNNSADRKNWDTPPATFYCAAAIVGIDVTRFSWMSCLISCGESAPVLAA